MLGNPELLESLEQIEMFRNVTTDLTTMITTNKELRQKVLAKEKLTEDEKKRMDDGVKRRDNLKKRLQRLITRIPAFMYLTDYREKTIKDLAALGYQSIPSDTNFFMVNLKRPIVPVIDEFKKKGVLVGRPFPPLNEHLRVSIGTPDEMNRFMVAFRDIMSTKTAMRP